jgi:hypothetical protein
MVHRLLSKFLAGMAFTVGGRTARIVILVNALLYGNATTEHLAIEMLFACRRLKEWWLLLRLPPLACQEHIQHQALLMLIMVRCLQQEPTAWWTLSQVPCKVRLLATIHYLLVLVQGMPVSLGTKRNLPMWVPTLIRLHLS